MVRTRVGDGGTKEPKLKAQGTFDFEKKKVDVEVGVKATVENQVGGGNVVALFGGKNGHNSGYDDINGEDILYSKISKGLELYRQEMAKGDIDRGYEMICAIVNFVEEQHMSLEERERFGLDEELARATFALFDEYGTTDPSNYDATVEKIQGFSKVLGYSAPLNQYEVTLYYTLNFVHDFVTFPGKLNSLSVLKQMFQDIVSSIKQNNKEIAKKLIDGIIMYLEYKLNEQRRGNKDIAVLERIQQLAKTVEEFASAHLDRTIGARIYEKFLHPNIRYNFKRHA